MGCVLYLDIGGVPEGVIESLLGLVGSEWTHYDEGRDYYTQFPDVGNLVDFLHPHGGSAFFLKIPAGGYVHRHRDNVKPWKTVHVPLTTNNGCLSLMHDPDEEYHLEVGRVYSVDRLREHSSVNTGNTDRIHLLVPVED